MKRTIVALVTFFMCFATSFAQLTIRVAGAHARVRAEHP